MPGGIQGSDSRQVSMVWGGMLSRSRPQSLLRTVSGILASVTCVLVLFAIFFSLLIQRFIESADAQRRDNLVHIVTLARNAIEPLVRQVRDGVIDRDVGIEQVRALVRQMTFSDQYGPNYVFMSAYDGTMLVQPFEPHKELTNQWDLRDDRGGFIIQALVVAAQSPEQKGFVTYYYPPPQGEASEPKLAYVAGIPELNAYIGAGMYMQQVEKDQQRLLQHARAFSIGVVFLLLIPFILSVRRLMRDNRKLAEAIASTQNAQDALRESEVRYRTVFEASADALFVMKDVFIDCNNAAVRMFGARDRNQLIGRTPHSVSPPQQSDSVSSLELAEEYVRAARAGVSQFFEWQHTRIDGAPFSTEVSLTKLDVSGEALLLASVRDVTLRKQAEVALRESEERYRELVECANVIVLKWDSAGKLVFANEFALTFFGYSLEELAGRHLVGTIVPEVDSAGSDLARLIDSIAADPDCFRVHENENVTKDGRRVWIRWNNRAVRDESGRVRGVLSLGSDISERIKTEQALRESEARFRGLFMKTPVPLLFASREGRVINVNQEFTATLGYTIEDIPDIEAWWTKAYPDPGYREQVKTYWLSAMSRAMRVMEDIESHEYRIAAKDGSIHAMLLGTRLLGDNHLVSFLDITERKAAEAEREALQAQLLHAQKMEAVGQLAGGVAHDFNNMLQAILGYVDLASEESGDDAVIAPFLDEIRKAADRSVNLTRQLLAFARRQTVAPIVIDLNASVDGMIRMLRRLIGEDIELVWNPHHGLWPIRIDPSQLDQILANLCVNARDAIGGVGRIAIETFTASFDAPYRNRQGDTAIGDYVVLTVRDNGRGMDPETLDRAFEPFFTTKVLGAGTGLGLATVYGIVKQNDGLIEVDSEPGKGTVFSVYFPRHEGELSDISEPVLHLAPRGDGESILLVEDEPSILNMTRDMLTGLGYRVLAANSPREALDLGRNTSSPIDALLTDVIMPEMNGRDLAEALRVAQPAMKCLFMSGYTAEVIAHHGILEKGIHFIEKPFTISGLAAKLHEVLRSDGREGNLENPPPV